MGKKKSRTAAKPLVWELTVEEQNSNWYFYQLNPRVFEYGVEAGLYRLIFDMSGMRHRTGGAEGCAGQLTLQPTSLLVL